MNEQLAQVGVIGMAVMRSNSARNLARRGFRVALYNRTVARTDEAIAFHGSRGDFTPLHELTDFAASLERSRRAILVIGTDGPTDTAIDALVPLPEKEDIVVDSGNSFFQDTHRHEQRLRDLGLHFVGTGISGGEVRALEGLLIMPGGSPESYEALGPILEQIATDVNSEPCCTYVGTNGAGHFVKTAHNGVGYADMQFIGEACELLKALGLGHTEMAGIFVAWNTGDLGPCLIEITAEVPRKTDPRTGIPLVDVTRDVVDMKGVGTQTVQSTLNLSTPVSTITEPASVRATSSSSELRAAAQATLHGSDRGIRVAGRDVSVGQIRQALRASKVAAYTQGLDEIRATAAKHGWSIDITEVAQIWRTSYIIRTRLLERIRFECIAGNLVTLLEASSIMVGLTEAREGWRTVVAEVVRAGVLIPGFPAALAYYD